MYVVAAIKYCPHATCFQLVPPANVVTGVHLVFVSLTPSSPTILYPQVHKVPSVLIAVVAILSVATCFQAYSTIVAGKGANGICIIAIPV